MIRFSSRQRVALRVALGETLRELANFAAGALVFGQLVGQQLLPWRVLLAGGAPWSLALSSSSTGSGDGRTGSHETAPHNPEPRTPNDEPNMNTN